MSDPTRTTPRARRDINVAPAVMLLTIACLGGSIAAIIAAIAGSAS